MTEGQSHLDIVSMGNWESVSEEDFPAVILRDGVVRITGVNQPMDIFRKPNQLEPEEFDEVWTRSVILEDCTRLPDPIDLLVSKQETEAALAHPDKGVGQLARKFLHELAEEGDPYAAEILRRV